MVIENVVDVVYTHEDLNFLSPLPGDFSPEADFVGIIEHQIVPTRKMGMPNSYKKFIYSCFLEGFWTPPKGIDSEDPALKMAKLCTSYNISSYRFIPASKSPVYVDTNNVMASLYWKKGKAIIYAVNFEEEKKTVNFKLNLEGKGFFRNDKILIQFNGKQFFSSVEELKNCGINLIFSSVESYLIEIKREKEI